MGQKIISALIGAGITLLLIILAIGFAQVLGTFYLIGMELGR